MISLVRDHGQSKTEDSLRSTADRRRDRSGSVALAADGGRRGGHYSRPGRRCDQADNAAGRARSFSRSRRPRAARRRVSAARLCARHPGSRDRKDQKDSEIIDERDRIMRLHIFSKIVAKFFEEKSAACSGEQMCCNCWHNSCRSGNLSGFALELSPNCPPVVEKKSPLYSST